MKVRYKILVLIAAFLLFFIGSIIVFNISIGDRSNVILEQRLLETREDYSKALNNSLTPIKIFIDEDTRWDEMIDFVNGKKDTTWLKESFINSALKLGINYVVVLDKNFQAKYAKDLTNGKLDVLGLTFDDYLKHLSEHQSTNFFISHNNQLIRVVASPVQPSTDEDRKTTPQGYVIVGEPINESKLSTIQKLLTGVQLELNLSEIIDLNPPSLNTKTGDIIYSESVTDFNKKQVAIITIKKNTPILTKFNQVFKDSLWIFINGCIILMMILFYLVNRWVNKPLANIEYALNTGNNSSLQSLQQDKSEFGEVSRLINQSNQQKEVLQQEIEIRRKSEQALQKALEEVKIANYEKDKAEQADLAKSLFLSTMSHEIRTPINGVIGIAHLLLAEHPTASQERYLKLLEFSAKHLKSLVDDILDFSKIESGKIEFSKSTFNLSSLVQDIYLTHQLRALEKKIELKVEHDDSLRNYLIGDNLRLSQILTNLLSNAIKFTEKGFVSIKYEVVESTPTEKIIHFTVKDTGIGISEEHIDTVFSHFTQANMEINRKYGGTGLGLAISQKLIELQGGNISVDSQLGVGSTFHVSMKFAIAGSLTNENKINTSSYKKDLDKMNVLVAEDNNINAFVVKQFLSKWNVGRMDFAMNGQEALDKINMNDDYDIVLMDLQMPIVDGYEATRQIRAHSKDSIKNIPIIALSADASSDTRENTKNLGFNSYITKPFDPDELFREMIKTTVGL